MRDFQNYTKGRGAARRRWWVWTLPVVLVALMAGGVALAFEPGDERARAPERLEAPRASWVQMMFGGEKVANGPFNVLVLGSDERPESEEEGSRTDTIMLVRVDPETGDIRLLSVPRDLLVEVAPGEENRINAAYNFGGIEQTITAFEEYSGVDVDHYAIVDFGGFKRVINAVGGVEVDVEDEIPAKHEIEDGLQTLNGNQSLFYVRYRGTAGGDLGRIKRQQRFVAALRSQALDWDTVKEVPGVIRVADRYLLTDLGLSQGISIGRVLLRRGPNAQMTAQQLQGDPETLENGDQVLVPDDEANEEILDEFRY